MTTNGGGAAAAYANRFNGFSPSPVQNAPTAPVKRNGIRNTAMGSTAPRKNGRTSRVSDLTLPHPPKYGVLDSSAAISQAITTPGSRKWTASGAPRRGRIKSQSAKANSNVMPKTKA